MKIGLIFTIWGLFTDIIGAFFLAKGFVYKNLEDIFKESSSGYWTVLNVSLAHSILKQKAEAEVGFVLLTLGFGGQMIGNLITSTCLLNLWEVILIITITTVATFASGWYAITILTKSHINRFDKLRKDKNSD